MYQYQVDKIREMLQSLKTTYSEGLLKLNALPLREKIKLAYTLRVVQDIDYLLASEEDLESLSLELQGYLKQNWHLISGTMLSYTAQPNSSITQFLCALVKEIVLFRNNHLNDGEKPTSELEILAPGLCLESINNNYPSLCVVEHHGLSDTEQLELEKLKAEIAQGLVPPEPEQIIFSGSSEDKESEWSKKECYFNLTPLRRSHPQLYQNRIERLQMSKELIDKIALLEKILRYKYLLERGKNFIQSTMQEPLEDLVIKGRYLIPEFNLNYILGTHIQSHYRGALIPVSTLVLLDDVPYRDKEIDRLEEKLEDLRRSLANLAVQKEQFNEKKSTFSFAFLLKEYTEKTKVLDQLKYDIKQLQAEEKKRLIDHSSYTKSYNEAKERLALLKGNKNTLLGHLTQLCKDLKFYDAHEGVGSQENAGAGVYESIRVFSEYYQTLGYHVVALNDCTQKLADYEVGVQLTLDENLDNFAIHYKFNHDLKEHSSVLFTGEFPQLLTRIDQLKQRNKELLTQNRQAIPIDKDRVFQELFSQQSELLLAIAKQGVLNLELEEKYKIPKELRSQIELLLDLAENPEQNYNATQNLATCIGTRREFIEPLISKHSVLLANINSSERYLAVQLERTEQEVKQRALLLEEKFKNKSYCGMDPLPITKKLLNNLNIAITIDSLATLNGLMQLEPKEIKELLEHDGRRKEINQLFSSIEGFYDFVFQHPSAKILAFLEATGSSLIKNLCRTNLECHYLLFGHTDEHFKALAKGLLLYAPHFDIPCYLKQHPEKEALINEILENKVDAVLAWANNPRLKVLSDSLKMNLIYTNCTFHLKKFFHIEAKRKVVEIILAGSDSFKEALNIEAELFGLVGAEKNNKEMVIKALLISSLAYRHASKFLQEDRQIKEIATIDSVSLRACVCNCILKQENINYVTEKVREHPLALRYLPERLRDNMLVVLAALSEDPFILNKASSRLQGNNNLQAISLIFNTELRVRACNCYIKRNKLGFIEEQIEEDFNVFRFLTKGLRNNSRLVVKALAQNSSTLQYASFQHRNDVFFIKIASISDPQFRAKVCDCYLQRDNIEYVVEEVRKTPILFSYLHCSLQDKFEVVVAALACSREIMHVIPEPLRSDPLIKKIAAIGNNKLRQNVCDCVLKSEDILFVLKKVKSNVEVFRYLPLELRENLQIFMAALAQNREVFQHAAKQFQLLPCIKNIAALTNITLRGKACNCYLKRKESNYVLEQIKKEPNLYPYLAQELYDNVEIVVTAISLNNTAFFYASPRLQEDECIQKIASINNHKIREKACNCYLQQKDIPFIIESIKKDWDLYPYLSKNLQDNLQVVVFALAFLQNALDYASERLQTNVSLKKIAKIVSLKERAKACLDYLKQENQAANVPLSPTFMSRYLFMNRPQRPVPLDEVKPAEQNAQFP